MSTWVQGTEVHQLGTSGASEASCTAAAKPQGAWALGVTCPIIVTGAAGTWVHLLLTCSTLVACEMVRDRKGKFRKLWEKRTLKFMYQQATSPHMPSRTASDPLNNIYNPWY